MTKEQLAELGSEYTETGAVILTKAELQRLLEERKRLLEALRHKAECGMDCASWDRQAKPCDCGVEAAIAFAEEAAR